METLDRIDDRLARVRAVQLKFKEAPHAGASAAQVQALRQRALAELGLEPPAQYLDFLRQCNGLDFNGLVIYDCDSSPDARRTTGFWQGLVPTNLLWRDSPALAQLLVLGDSDMDVYALDPRDGRFHAIDKVAKESFDSWDSFNAMLEALLAKRL